MTRRKKNDEPVDVDAIVRRIVKHLVDVQSCTIASCKIPKSCKAEVLELLEREGLEVTKTQVRRPLRDQLRDFLAAGAYLPLTATALRSNVKGAAAKESKKVALELVAAGEAHLVVRGRSELLVPATASIVPRDRLTSLIKSMDASLKLARSAGRKRNGATILREDLRALAGPVVAELAVTDTVAAPESPVDVARRLTDPAVGLAFVPAVVAALARGSNRDAAKEDISEAARQGEIELRPESGMGRLSKAEREACISGSDGTLLSWIRVRARERR